MAGVRTLLQREREARRIQHPHLAYSKSGALSCTVCNLNVKSEALWEGHLKSANHRRNVREAAAETSGVGNGKKRKIEEVTEEDNPRKRKTEEFDGDTRKKREVSFATSAPEETPATTSIEQQAEAEAVLPGFVRSEAAIPQTTPSPPPTAAPDPAATVPTVDEDEWAAFEAEVAPLARDQPQDYTAATISAAPVSATELAAQQAASERRLRRDLEAEDEKEEEEQRMADEFDVMEEMEERVRRLKEKREALRIARPDSVDTPAAEPAQNDAQKAPPNSDSDDDGEVDDWYT